MSEWMLIVQGVLAFILVGLVLLQRSEGGALGIGSSTMGNFMTPQGTIGFLTKVTAVVGALFMILGLLFSFLAKEDSTNRGLFDDQIQGASQTINQTRQSENESSQQGIVPIAE